MNKLSNKRPLEISCKADLFFVKTGINNSC